MKLTYHPEVAKILSIRNEKIHCPFCATVITLKSTSSLLTLDIDPWFNGSCECKHNLDITATRKEGIYFIQYYLWGEDCTYMVNNNFSQRKYWILKYNEYNENLSPFKKYDLYNIDFLFETFDQLETYLLFL